MSNASSNSQHPSTSGPQRQQPLTRKDERRSSNGLQINAAFDPETRRKIANIITRRPATPTHPPSLMGEEANKEHPLLTLQSVSGGGGNGSRIGAGNDGAGEKKPQLQKPQQQQQTQKPMSTMSTMQQSNDADSQKKALADTESKLSNTSPNQTKSPVLKGNTNAKEKEHKSKLRRIATLLIKFIAVNTLILLWFLLMHSVAINSESEREAPKILSNVYSRISAAQLGVASSVREWSERVPSFLFDTTPPIPTEQLEERITLGRDLLRKYDDASGSVRTCEGALHAIVDGRGRRRDQGTADLVSLVSSSLTVSSNAAENEILVNTLLCMGEARLSLHSSPVGSAPMKWAQLLEAKESYEAASAVDPTNPSARSGLGLSYLLLGVTDSGGDNSIQFIFQSIQHLKAAVGLTSNAKSESSDIAAAIHAASMHNLGLAYITLDGMSSAEPGAKTTHFSDWASSLESSHSLAESWAFQANTGAMLLQMGKLDEAISTLEHTATELCAHSLMSKRRKEACLTVQQNLALAKHASQGGQGDTRNDGMPSLDGYSILEEVARWNADASSSVAAADLEPSEDINATSALDNGTETTIEEVGEANETTFEVQESSSVVPAEADRTDMDTDAHLEVGQEDEAVDPPASPWGLKKVKPEMQNALAALEKATSEGPHRSRLLLALAKARSSSGDSAGAVDAALKAIGAAASDEETDTSTAYLEKLMETMAGEEEATVQSLEGDRSPSEKPEVASSFVDRKDFAVSELQLKLELERLRYKVLEQEMMLGRQGQNTLQYTAEHHAIDYRQQEVVVQDAPRRHDSGSIDENIVLSKTIRKPIEHETKEAKDVETQKETAPDTSSEQSESVSPPQNEADTVNIDVEGTDEVSLSQPDTPEATPEDLVAENQAEADTNQTTTEPKSETPANATEPEEEVPSAEPIELPNLFEPALEAPGAIPPTAKSKMKMADAYLDKGQYALASKQFLQVIKKAPDHLPAHLGYATALERAGKSKQINTAALAYGNATRVAIIQGEKIDPIAKSGSGGIAENILRRAVQICKSAPTHRLETLQQLSAYAHTAALAADIYFEIGTEIVKQGIEKGENKADATHAFEVANEFAASRNDTATPYHMRSIVELGKIALESESDAGKVIELFGQVKDIHMDDDVHVELLVLVGRAHVSLGALETAITEYTRAISFPETPSTPSAHHELAIALKKNNGDEHEINLHFEKALDLGMDPTQEAIEALGERNMAVMRALNRQYYKSFNNPNADGAGGGGIMSGGGVGAQSSSVFAPRQEQAEAASAQSQTLELLEQGAASYDGHQPGGGEVEGTESSLSAINARKKQGSESHLSDLKR